VNEPIGDSTGQPDQAFVFRQTPVLPGEEIEVRELNGKRADVEWRILALEVLGSGPGDLSRGYAEIQALEDALSREGTLADIQRGRLRLRRDRDKRVVEAWVLWQRRDHLYGSGPGDRHYLLERSRGRLRFGDGLRGKIPPAGAAVQCRRFHTGGGSAGNVPAGVISQLQAGIGGVEAVFNPRPAEGGADAESLEAYARRGPQALRSRGRALTPADYEILARASSPAVAVAHALPGIDGAGRERPGYVTLVIIPHDDGESARPFGESARPGGPSYGLRKLVERYISEHAPASMAAGSGLTVTGPRYQPVGVSARLAPRDAAQAGAVAAESEQALTAFFHPLRGGPEGCGWAPGRPVYLSDVAALLERIPGVDYVEELQLLLEGGLQGDGASKLAARIPPGWLAAAGEFRISVVMRQT
jgi:predicted phage baseplate assembly protein